MTRLWNVLVVSAMGCVGLLAGQMMADEAPAKRPTPSGPAPVLMFASVNGGGGIRLSAPTAVWKYATRTDGSVGVPGGKVTDFTVALKDTKASTASGVPISTADLRQRLEHSTLVVVSMTDAVVPPGFLEVFKPETIVLVNRNRDSIRQMLRVTTPEFEPGTDVGN